MKKWVFLFLFFVPYITNAKEWNFKFQNHTHINGLFDGSVITNNNKIFIVSSDGTIYLNHHKHLSLHSSLFLKPIKYKHKFYFLLNNGQIAEVDIKKKKRKTLWDGSMPFLTNPFITQNKLYFITSNNKLYVFDLKNKNSTFIQFIPRPLKNAFSISNNVLFIKTMDHQRYTISIKINKVTSQTFFEKNHNFPPIQSNYKFLFEHFYYTKNLYLAIDQGNLISFTTNEPYTQILFDKFDKNFQYYFYSFKDMLYIYNASGDIYHFQYLQSQYPQYSPIIIHLTNVQKLSVDLISNFLVIQNQNKTFFSKKMQNFRYQNIKDILVTDINHDKKDDIFILMSTNPTLDYDRLFLLMQTQNTQFYFSVFDTIGVKKINDIYLDLDHNGEKELVLFQEIGFNLSTDKSKRIFIPDVYSLQNNVFRWNSIQFPKFYKKKMVTIKQKKSVQPFHIKWANNLWKTYTENIYLLEKNLITLYKQLQSIKKRPRNSKNLLGLSLWFYKKGLEYKKNGWDNLALFVFHRAYKLDKKNKFILFQIARIYLKYGYTQESLRLYSNSSFQSNFFYIKKIFYKAMEEEKEPLIINPTDFYLNYNLGEIYFLNYQYTLALPYFKKVIKTQQNSFFYDRALKYTGFCYLYTQNYKMARKLFTQLYKKNHSLEIKTILDSLSFVQ